ncbi:MAG: prolipoprotein diacylglyceryl transferase family protein [Patescibacteria group bacterium]
MWPFLEISGVFLPTYNLALTIGVLAGATQLFFAARRKRMILQFLADNFFILLFAALVAARLAEVLLHNYSLLEFPFFWAENGGFDFFGGAIGFLIALAILSRRYNENFFSWLDLTLLATAPALFFHHIGTFLVGSAYGTQTALPWGVTFTNPEAVGYSTLPIHPTQIYAALLVLGLFVFASAIFKNTAKTGKAGIFLLLTLSIAYFFLDFLRGDSAPTFGLLRASQYFTLTLALVAAILVVKIKQSTYEARSGEFQIHPKN